MNAINADRQEQVARQIVLFPPDAPAGWDVSALRTREPAFPRKTPQEHLAATRRKLRETAASIFEEAIADQFCASEAADAVVHSPEYIALREEHLAWVARTKTPRADHLDARRIFPANLWTLSPSLGRTLSSAVEIENVTSPALKRIQGLPPMIQSSLSAEKRQQDPLWFLTDPLLPDVVVRGMFASHRAYAMAAALDGFVHRPRFSPKLIRATASMWKDDARSYLVLLASIPEAGVSPNIIPPEERFSLERESTKQASLLAHLNDAA